MIVADTGKLAAFELDPAFPGDLARKVRLIALDVDGILTDGGLYYDASGLTMKRFDCQDGVAVKLAQQAGLVVVIITGMESAAVEQRVRVLGIEEFHSGIFDKASVMQSLLDKYGLTWDEAAYAGDDWLDLPVLRRVGLSMTVCDAQPEVRGLVHYVSRRGGGRGAVRELVRHILAAQGKLAELLDGWASK
ncbi:MAG: phenylphosphate carboxylase subunit delta [Deltaproteobacteria bacterium]|jgi:3-deoxy-D-manno-octulosonate 8-phosphate phosphatase (KDO 8-P phosphatase)|nr:phenylphosphate carboxylase subunit delta [Deltaproteobacteria bacterium]